MSASIRSPGGPATARHRRTGTARKERALDVTCGIDWAEDHHDVAVVDRDARLLGKLRIDDDATGFQDLLRFLAENGDKSG
jgi:hypothetical protein